MNFRQRTDPVDSYFSRLEFVPGWLAPIDFIVLRTLAQMQTNRGITGDFLEIGVYCGKTAILLRLLCEENENLVVCDLFDSLDVPAVDRSHISQWYGAGVPRARFEETYRQYHLALPTILEIPSVELPSAGLGAQFRLLHIDGSHVFQTVRSDIGNAKVLSCPGAFVALDDYGRSHCPGVPPAVWQAHFELGLEPFLLTEGKLYAHWGAYDEDLLDDLEQWSTSAGLVVERHRVLDKDLLRVIEPTSSSTFKKLQYLVTPPILSVTAKRLRRLVAGWTDAHSIS